MAVVNGDFLWSALDAFDKVILQQTDIPFFLRIVCFKALGGIACRERNFCQCEQALFKGVKHGFEYACGEYAFAVIPVDL